MPHVAHRLTVPSFTTPGEHYTVRWAVDRFVCECRAYAFSKRPQTCKHCTLVAMVTVLHKECRGKGHTPICAQCVTDELASLMALDGGVLNQH